MAYRNADGDYIVYMYILRGRGKERNNTKTHNFDIFYSCFTVLVEHKKKKKATI